jgi:hypothetical protein
MIFALISMWTFCVFRCNIICRHCHDACLRYGEDEQLPFASFTKLKEFKPGTLTQVSSIIFESIHSWEVAVRQVKESALDVNIRDVLLQKCTDMHFPHPITCVKKCDVSSNLKLKFITVRCRFLSKELTKKSTDGSFGSYSMTCHQLAMNVKWSYMEL